MKKVSSKAATTFFVLAIVFTALGSALGLIIAPILAFALGVWLAAKIVFAVGAVFGFAGGVFWFLIRRVKELPEIAAFLNSKRRSEVGVLARELGLTVFKAEMLISKCIAEGLVEGYFDRGKGEFFTREAFLHQLSIQECPHCGAPATRIRLLGDDCRCEACGRTITYSVAELAHAEDIKMNTAK